MYELKSQNSYKKTGINLYDLGLGNDLLDNTKDDKRKTGKMHFTKAENLCTSKHTIHGSEKTTYKWGEILGNHII